MFNIVLYQPEIPQNTGNISRTCACTGSALHIIRPMGFEITDKHLKRAGLDYWDKLNLTYYDSLEEFFQKTANGGRYFYLSKKASKRYTDIDFKDGDYLIFGKETKGLPEHIVFDNPETALRIPMAEGLRSLNLSNTVALVLYEALRQNGFEGLV
ncbi:MAG: tRNA (uridine(34)/cytosine(34)/5-carboxymethylaminomethyluridine(34)-2'-O)-methyltransferase TrmL [Clostridiales bacterium]|nr:tRNA (uridine(34)/cytosine(34)/5-carboxymethylaminomethyluridine(34)-2'-O)-methyltransferase TrmL [Clostridiales bacterium]